MSRRAGFALVFSLFLVLALTGLALGMLAVGSREALIADRMVRGAQASVAAESAVRAALSTWSSRDVRGLVSPASPLAPLPSPDPSVALVVERLDSSLFLLRSEAAAPDAAGPPLVRRAAALVRALDARALAAAFPAAVVATSAGRVEGGAVSGDLGCPDAGAAAALEGPAWSVEAGAVVTGSPAIREQVAPPLPAIADPAGPLIGALADLSWSEPEASPRPTVREGVCDGSARNWGATAVAHPCHSLLPLVHAPGSLVIRQGELRGVLIVAGDLTLSGTVRLHGMVVVGGHLIVNAGAEIIGGVRAEHVTMRGGRIGYDGCELEAASRAPALDRGFRPPRRWWVPVF